jgi:hypothetical protein
LKTTNTLTDFALMVALQSGLYLLMA